VIVGETYNTPHNKCSIATGMEWNTHKQVCKTLKQIGKQGMYVGRSSALKRIFAYATCQLMQLQKQISCFEKL